MTEVVAALIWEGEKFMICQRPAHKKRGLEIDRESVIVIRHPDQHILLPFEDLSFEELRGELDCPDLSKTLHLDCLPSMQHKVHVADIIIDGKCHRILHSRFDVVKIHIPCVEE